MAGEIVHRKQLFGGHTTAETLWRNLAFEPHEKCLCGGRPVARIQSFIPAAELRQRSQSLYAQIVLESIKRGVPLPIVDTKHGPMFRIGNVTPCQSCRVEAERQAAKGPSYCLVWIEDGPGPDKAVSQVPRLQLVQ